MQLFFTSVEILNGMNIIKIPKHKLPCLLSSEHKQLKCSILPRSISMFLCLLKF